jgi:predicted O-methyltransferase YrrM
VSSDHEVGDVAVAPEIETLTAALDGVDGWLHIDEAAQLYDSVLAADPNATGPCVVEIGSWKGRSTIALALAVRATGRAMKVVAIDPHLGDNGEFQDESETFTEFTRNIERAGVDDLVTPLRSLSHDARPEIADASVAVLFLDGSHRYDDVRTDLADWISALRPGAVMAFNDSSKPGVYRALSEGVLRRRSAFRKPLLVRSTLFLTYEPRAAWTTHDDREWLKLRAVLGMRRAAHRVVPHLPGFVKRAGNRVSQRAVSGT